MTTTPSKITTQQPPSVHRQRTLFTSGSAPIAPTSRKRISDHLATPNESSGEDAVFSIGKSTSRTSNPPKHTPNNFHLRSHSHSPFSVPFIASRRSEDASSQSPYNLDLHCAVPPVQTTLMWRTTQTHSMCTLQVHSL